MKLLAKPISSPARVTTTDNFPPPLLRFLKTHGDSKSRRSTSRSRSSPIFITKRNQIQAQVEVEEPSSPEVTCMGQVHVRSNKRSNQAKKRKKNKKKERASISGYQWIRKKLFCCTLKRSGSLRLKREEKPEELQETQEEEKVEVFVTKAPPKNALLLMRCRSEPYRASSLANRFWGSPPETEQQKQSVEDEETEHHTLEDEPEPPSCRDSAVESKTDLESEEEKVGFCEGLESSSTRSGGGGGGVRPLLLTRCKSEPARRSEKFEGFWKKRLGFVDISTTRF